MNTRNLLPVWLVALALALPASAQDEAPESPAGEAQPPAGETGPPAGETTDAGDGDRAADEDDADEVEEREFIFSEEIPADQQVTFPVDI